MSAGEFSQTELLITVLARLLQGVRTVAVGASSPIPGAAALLAQAQARGPMHVTVLGSGRFNDYTDGGRELFDRAAQGRIDAFFLGGAQIDGRANVNLVGLGEYPKLDVRFAGSYGSAYLYFLIPRVILFREEHSPRVLVKKVDFISAPGVSEPGVYRPGGPHSLATGKCVFRFEREKARFRLESAHPGVTLDEISATTGFEFDIPSEVPETPAPSAGDLALIRGRIGAAIAETYPKFAANVLHL